MNDTRREKHDWHVEPAERVAVLMQANVDVGLSSDETKR